jgi:regulator of sigma E protease
LFSLFFCFQRSLDKIVCYEYLIYDKENGLVEAIMGTVGKILLGLVGLGVVVFVHELGHFIAARSVGIEVTAFALGWGKTILKKTFGKTEYRLALFPIGGYCKMRGEDDFQEAYDEKAKTISASPGSYYAAAPWRRIIVSVAGPLFNMIFAVLVLSIIYGVGFNVSTLENRIILSSDVDGPSETLWPAEAAGLETGDRIIAIDGKATDNSNAVQLAVVPNAERELDLTVERDGQILSFSLEPLLDKSTGAGKIGVYFWTDPLLSGVVPDSPAAKAGLQSGDRIISVNGRAIPYTAALNTVLASRPGTLDITYERNGQTLQTKLTPLYTVAEDGSQTVDIGISYQTISYHTPNYGFFGSLAKGAAETWQLFTVSVQSFALLFKGVDLTQAVSGPVRITFMVGEAASEGFSESFGLGILSMAEFLALISIALGITNLLPLPVLDGGSVVLFFVEMLRRRPLSPRGLYAFQMVGVVLIAGLLLFAVFGDILFLVRR